MYRYLIIEGTKPLNDHISVIETIFSAFIEIKHIQIETYHIIIEFEHQTDVSFYDIILNVMSDTYQDLRLYESYVFDTANDRKKHQTFVMKKLALIPFNKCVYLNDHSLLKVNIHQLDQEIKQFTLRKYEHDQIMLETIKIYLESNQNMVIAAKKLYVHRNTLIQRIDKFYQVTGFDIRRFNDAFLIYHFVK